MAGKARKRFKKIFYAVLVLFLLFNLLLINQAYHLTHFYEHGTVKSIEEQTKGLWAQAGVALFGLKQEKLAGNKPDSPFTNIKLKTVDSITLDAWLITVPHAKGTIALFHGHGSEKSANISQSDEFNEMGYSTLLVDFRAHGQSEGNTCSIGYFEAADVKAAYDYLHKHGEQHILLYGISLGAATITKAIAGYHLTPDKIILEMPFSSLSATVEGKIRMAGLPAEPIAGMLTFWGGCINGFWAFNMRPKDYVKKINCPVLLQWGKKDPGVTEASIRELFANIASSSKRFVVYENSAHENLCENEPDKWEDAVKAFLEKP